MSEFIIKMTAARTNPQLIREVRISSDRTAGELAELGRIVFEYDDVRGSLLNAQETKQSPEKKLEEVLQTGDFLSIRYADKKQLPVFLEVLEKTEEPKSAAEELPELLRHRCVPNRRREKDRYFVGKSAGADYQKYINREVRKQFAPDMVLPDFNWRIAQDWSMLLTDSTVAEMKTIVKEGSLLLSSTLRKNDLQRELPKAANDRLWEKVLRELSVREYGRLKKLCILGDDCTGETYEMDFPVLNKYQLIKLTYWYGLVLGKEFMEFYESWLESGKEKEYLREHAAESCMLAGCRLYGFVDQKLYRELLGILCPEKQDDSRNSWNNAGLSAIENGMKKVPGREIYYDTKTFSGDDIVDFYSQFLLMDRLHYVPKQSELEALAVMGNCLPEKEWKSLNEILKKKFDREEREARFITGQITEILRAGMPNDEIFCYLEQALRPGRKKLLQPELVEILNRAQKTMRKVTLSGFTQEEMTALTAQKMPVKAAKKIYPNDPCPCGSGKKYKQCCGRK